MIAQKIYIRITGSGRKTHRGLGKFSIKCNNHKERSWTRFEDEFGEAIKLAERHIKEEHPT